MNNADYICLYEVSPRDGLQAETVILPSQVKIEFINRLSQSGLSKIEVTSFSDPRRIPQLADAEEVYRTIDRSPTTLYFALIPNLFAFYRALASGVSSIAVLSSASDAFSQANIGCDNEAALQTISSIVEAAKQFALPIRAYISCAYSCPFSGRTDPLKVAEIAAALVRYGCNEIALADTTGVSTPVTTRELLTQVAKYVPLTQIAMHFHDANGHALASAIAAIEAGVRTFDTAVDGLGGCPASSNLVGNLATERLCAILQKSGLRTGINLDALVTAKDYLRSQLTLYKTETYKTRLSQ